MKYSKNKNIGNDSWKTPKHIIKQLEDKYGKMFDPCPLNHDLDLWNELEIEWKKVNFINPPYSRKLKEAFINKAYEESLKGKKCIMLLPVSTSSRIFHNIILPNAKITFIQGRLKFEGNKTISNCMHDSMIVIFG